MKDSDDNTYAHEVSLDGNVLRELRQLDPQDGKSLVVELMGVFFVSAEQNLEKMRSAVAAGDISGLRREAHSLKSSSGNLGARKMSAICRTIEAGASVASPNELLEALCAEYLVVKRLLEEEAKKIA